MGDFPGHGIPSLLCKNLTFCVTMNLLVTVECASTDMARASTPFLGTCVESAPPSVQVFVNYM